MLERKRELDLLAFELAEIDQIAPTVAEEAELGVERERLRHSEGLRAAIGTAAEALSPSEEGLGANGGHNPPKILRPLHLLLSRPPWEAFRLVAYCTPDFSLPRLACPKVLPEPATPR